MQSSKILKGVVFVHAQGDANPSHSFRPFRTACKRSWWCYPTYNSIVFSLSSLALSLSYPQGPLPARMNTNYGNAWMLGPIQSLKATAPGYSNEILSTYQNMLSYYFWFSEMHNLCTGNNCLFLCYNFCTSTFLWSERISALTLKEDVSETSTKEALCLSKGNTKAIYSEKAELT